MERGTLYIGRWVGDLLIFSLGIEITVWPKRGWFCLFVLFYLSHIYRNARFSILFFLEYKLTTLGINHFLYTIIALIRYCDICHHLFRNHNAYWMAYPLKDSFKLTFQPIHIVDTLALTHWHSPSIEPTYLVIINSKGIVTWTRFALTL